MNSSILASDKTRELNILEEDEYVVVLEPNTHQWRIIEGECTDLLLSHYDSFPPLSEKTRAPTQVVTVFLTNKCNLRCGYCRFKDLTHTGIESGDDDVQGIIETLKSLSNGKDKMGIYFQGGEPLLEYRKIDLICDSLRTFESTCHFDFYVQTNGTVYSDKVLNVLLRHNVNIGISFDGQRIQHDTARPYVGGKNSHADVMMTIDKLKEKEIPFGIFCVITKPELMIDSYDYFINDLNITNFLMAPLELNGDEDINTVKYYLETFVDSQIEILRRNMELFNTRGVKITEELTHLYLQRKILVDAPLFACDVTPYSKCGSDMLSVERDGHKTECQNLRQKQNMPAGARKEMLRRHDICTTCNIRGHCSTPVCFARFSEKFNVDFKLGEAYAENLIDTICNSNKRREAMVFNLFRKNKNALLNYFFHESSHSIY